MAIKKILWNLAKIAVVGGAFAYLYHKGQLRFDGMRATFSHPGLLALGILGAFLPMVISFYRHWVLLRALGIDHYSVGGVTRLGFIGCFFSTFMPGSIGGDVIKIGYIIHDTHENAKAIASVLIDRVQGLFGLLLLGGLAMIVASGEVIRTASLHKTAVTVFSIIGVVVCAAGVGVLAMLKGRKVALGAWALLAAIGAWGAWALYDGCGRAFQFVRQPEEELTAELANVLLHGRFIVAIGGCLLAALLALLVIPSCQPGHHFSQFVIRRVPGGKQLMSLMESVLLFHNDLPALFYTLFLSLLTHGFNLLSVYCFGLAMELPTEPTLFSVFFAAPLAYIANSLPVPGGGLGVGEAVFADVMALCRTPAGAAIIGGGTVFLTWRIWYVLLSLAGGLPCYLAGKQEIADVRKEMAAQEGAGAPEMAPGMAPEATPENAAPVAGAGAQANDGANQAGETR